MSSTSGGGSALGGASGTKKAVMGWTPGPDAGVAQPHSHLHFSTPADKLSRMSELHEKVGA